MGKALEDWVFSTRANLGKESTKASQKPQMLTRFISRVVHPLIHAGHGAEFGLPGMMAEGLAQCAVHQAETHALTPPTLFDGTLFLQLGTNGIKALSAFHILGEVHDNLRTIAPMASRIQDFDAGLGQHAEVLLHLAGRWELDLIKLTEREYLNSKIEELAFLVVAIYGVAGWSSRGKDQDLRADFFLCVQFSP
jgi:Questin oxidase-like